MADAIEGDYSFVSVDDISLTDCEHPSAEEAQCPEGRPVSCANKVSMVATL